MQSRLFPTTSILVWGHMILAETLLKAGSQAGRIAVIIDASHAAPKVESAQFARCLAVEERAISGRNWTMHCSSIQHGWRCGWRHFGGPGHQEFRSYRCAEPADPESERLRSGSYSSRSMALRWGVHNDQLAAGVNLAVLKTPATDQAMKVYQLANSHEEVHYDELRNMEIRSPITRFPSQGCEGFAHPTGPGVAKEMLQTAQPVPHKFELVPVPAE